MATDHNQGRRGHFHRGRRGPDRRGPERRQGPPPEQGSRPERGERSERGERVDVEQIMREIRGRIAQRSGVDLSNQQIQELAARRLEAILDPRGLKPELLEQLRRSAGERTVAVDAAPQGTAQSYPFDEATLYDSPNGLLRFLRKLFHPILRMLFNPTPIAHALAIQSRLNADLATRDAERDRRQAEWNALHYEILQRLATEVSRGSIETQSLALRVESLAAKVDFNERRVRGMEGAPPRPPRQQEAAQPAAQPVSSPQADTSSSPSSPSPSPATAEGQPGDAPRRRRRRRRGRRAPGAVVPAEAAASAVNAPVGEDDDGDADEGFEEDAAAPQPVALDHRLPEAVAHHEETAAPVPASAPAPEPVRDDTPHTPDE